MAASAPGKLILFGEHAVVFGEPALATAINLRAEVFARPHAEWRADGGSLDEPRYRYVRGAVQKAKAQGPLWLEVRSMVPSGAGLGSSAAVTVATLGALHGMAAAIDPKRIAREAFEVEHEVQGRASAPAPRFRPRGAADGPESCDPHGSRCGTSDARPARVGGPRDQLRGEADGRGRRRKHGRALGAAPGNGRGDSRRGGKGVHR